MCERGQQQGCKGKRHIAPQGAGGGWGQGGQGTRHRGAPLGQSLAPCTSGTWPRCPEQYSTAAERGGAGRGTRQAQGDPPPPIHTHGSEAVCKGRHKRSHVAWGACGGLAECRARVGGMGWDGSRCSSMPAHLIEPCSSRTVYCRVGGRRGAGQRGRGKATAALNHERGRGAAPRGAEVGCGQGAAWEGGCTWVDRESRIAHRQAGWHEAHRVVLRGLPACTVSHRVPCHSQPVRAARTRRDTGHEGVAAVRKRGPWCYTSRVVSRV